MYLDTSRLSPSLQVSRVSLPIDKGSSLALQVDSSQTGYFPGF